MITNRDRVGTEEDYKDISDKASAATGSSPSQIFSVELENFINEKEYINENKDRDLGTEEVVLEILHCALQTAEEAVKIMKEKEKQRKEGEMIRGLEGVNITGKWHLIVGMVIEFRMFYLLQFMAYKNRGQRMKCKSQKSKTPH